MTNSFGELQVSQAGLRKAIRDGVGRGRKRPAAGEGSLSPSPTHAQIE